MRVVEVNGDQARCELKGVERSVSLLLLQDEAVHPGEFVMVHVGFAIEKVRPRAARSAWQLLDQMLAGRTTPDA